MVLDMIAGLGEKSDIAAEKHAEERETDIVLESEERKREVTVQKPGKRTANFRPNCWRMAFAHADSANTTGQRVATLFSWALQYGGNFSWKAGRSLQPEQIRCILAIWTSGRRAAMIDDMEGKLNDGHQSPGHCGSIIYRLASRMRNVVEVPVAVGRHLSAPLVHTSKRFLGCQNGRHSLSTGGTSKGV